MKQSGTVLFTVYLLLSFVGLRIGAELPSIRPVPCTNHMTGESGICTFNWSCVNVAHGVHIGACVDRFFIGTCCKIPSDPESSSATRSPDYGASQTTRRGEQVAPSLHHPLAAEVEEEKVKRTGSSIDIGHFNVTFNPLDYFGVAHNATSITDSYHEPEIVFDHVLNSSQKTGNWDHSPSLSPIKKPMLSGSFFQSLFFAHKNNDDTYKETIEEKPELTTSSYEILSENHSSESSSSDIGPTSHSFALAEAWNRKTTAVTESVHDLRKPVTVHETHNERKPVLLNEQHDLRRPVPFNEEHDQRWPVLEEDSHDQRRPVLVEDSHNQRLPVINHFQEGNTGTDKDRNPVTLGTKVNTTPTTKYEFSTSEITDVNSPTQPSQNLFPPSENPESSYSTDQTIPPLSFTLEDSGTKDNIYSINTISPDFALFVRPTFSWPSLKPAPFYPENNPTSTPEPNFKDVSRICGRSRGVSTMGRIVGGRKSHYLRWPWMISLRRFEGKTYKHKCGATLLNQFWAVTAAHCVEGKLPMDLTLRLGEYNFGRSDELHPHVERRVYVMVIHPEFDHITYENDLALLRFHEPVELQANIIPICLPHSMDDITGRIAVVTGWGRLSEEGELPAHLHEVQMPILSNEECEQMFYEAGYAENIRDVFVCAGVSGGGLDACEGDSGGPMVVRGDEGQWVLVGLISWGMGCAAPKQPGVYTRISQFTDWIDGIISH